MNLIKPKNGSKTTLDGRLLLVFLSYYFLRLPLIEALPIADMALIFFEVSSRNVDRIVVLNRNEN